jgi:hypothetical protein
MDFYIVLMLFMKTVISAGIGLLLTVAFMDRIDKPLLFGNLVAAILPVYLLEVIGSYLVFDSYLLVYVVAALIIAYAILGTSFLIWTKSGKDGIFHVLSFFATGMIAILIGLDKIAHGFFAGFFISFFFLMSKKLYNKTTS